jgi:hypothetical protein
MKIHAPALVFDVETKLYSAELTVRRDSTLAYTAECLIGEMAPDSITAEVCAETHPDEVHELKEAIKQARELQKQAMALLRPALSKMDQALVKTDKVLAKHLRRSTLDEAKEATRRELTQ